MAKHDTYYLLGSSGLRVSRLALGTLTFGPQWGWGADEGDCARILDAYIDLGGNFVDTADCYTEGASEKILGRLISERRARDRMVIATKASINMDPGNPNGGGNGRKHIMAAVDASLRRLCTDYIDLYVLHSWDCLTSPEEVMRTFDDLVRAGKIRHIGLSNVPAWYAAQAHTLATLRGWEPVTTLQMQYNLVQRGVEDEFIPLCQSSHIGLTVWSPLCSGLLSGKYNEVAGETEKSRRLDVMAKSGDPAWNMLTQFNLKIASAVQQVATELGRPASQIAINWIANRPAVASVIIGATSIAQLEENMAALAFEMPDEVLQRLEKVSAIPKRYPYDCFLPSWQATLTGGTAIGARPRGYRNTSIIDAVPMSHAAKQD